MLDLIFGVFGFVYGLFAGLIAGLEGLGAVIGLSAYVVSGDAGELAIEADGEHALGIGVDGRRGRGSADSCRDLRPRWLTRRAGLWPARRIDTAPSGAGDQA